MMSISTIDDAVRKVLEPYASSIQTRLDALKKFSNVGIQTSIFFGPICPSISIDDIPQIIDTLIAYDTTNIWLDSLHLKQGIYENIKKSIIKNKEIYNAFLKNDFHNQDHYTKIRSEIFRIGKNRNITIIDAF
jgi:DNA repair photolyase